VAVSPFSRLGHTSSAERAVGRQHPVPRVSLLRELRARFACSRPSHATRPRRDADPPLVLAITPSSNQLLNESVLDLKYGTRVSDETVSKNQRRDLMKGVQRGDDATERLDAAVTMATRTDEVGDAILQNLQEQREKIVSARVSAETMEDDMNTSERKMTRMACEKCIQKWVLWVIAACVLFGLILFAYYKLEIEPKKGQGAQASLGASAGLGKSSGARRLLHSHIVIT